MDTATELFRRHGIRGIGVDAIAEAAGTNKMTLYRHFGSKDELIAECLRHQAEKFDRKWTAIEAAGDARAQLSAWIRLAGDYLEREKRGCDLANTAVELHEDDDHPARAVIEAFKIAQRDRLAVVCRAAGADDAELLADTLYLMLEGARVSRQSIGPEGPCSRFVKAAEAAVRSAIGEPRQVAAT
nr:TetR/AcrR family transcriptional regulator [Alsobacter ponti]